MNGNTTQRLGPRAGIMVQASAAAACILLVGVGAFTVDHNRRYDARMAEARATLDAAIERAGEFELLAAGGQFSRRAALARLAAEIAPDRGPHPLMVFKMPGLAAGSRPAIAGSNRAAAADPIGRLVVENVLNEVRRFGSARHEHRAAPPDGGAPVRKIAFAGSYLPWGIVVVSDVPVDDLDTLYRDRLRATLGAALAVLLAVGGMLATASGIGRPRRLAGPATAIRSPAG